MCAGSDIDWKRFTPQERAVIVFVRCRDQVLLINKKRGLGAGKVNGPGGRIDPGESAPEAAVREVREETGIEIAEPVEHATLHFSFRDGYTLTAYVFVTRTFTGDPVQTEEADPFWAPLDAIPYLEMWADDRYWLPEVLAGRYVDGQFVFEKDVMLWSHLTVREYVRAQTKTASATVISSPDSLQSG